MNASPALIQSAENTLLYFLDDPAMVLSGKGRIAYMNPAFRKRFGISREKAVGAVLSDLVPGWMGEPILARLRDLEPDS